ncbi:MAG: chemotaxis protein CheA [Piscirickettsiaceae bacterium]|nr:MAG: chemotaxis protein CheA [Piscirickettsiaceae bacterium]
MAIDLNDEILQDFLTEASEILELLNEQLIELEQSPNDMELLNSIFRGFHTIKGGAGFLALDGLVGVCHISEDVFDILRNGKLVADSDLMDSFLKVLDVVNTMFDSIREGIDPEPADPALIAELEKYKRVAAGEVSEPVVEKPVEIEQSTNNDKHIPDEVEKEFEAMLEDALSASSVKVPESKANETESENITDDEFDRLLDELHGKNKGPTVKAGNSIAGDGNITDEEFDNLLDQMHGVGKGPTTETTVTGKAAIEADVVKENKSADIKVTADKKAKAPVKTAAKAETTVRVDTQRLDDIMNMVGELVLVRNRLSKLSSSNDNEEMAKAISNLDIVTADLQLSVMKTRMQPIKKAFGRFPRVVRDLSRSLDKKIRLELVGEETDLDKNLVDALSDPLVHLVRNAVDHGIELPEDRKIAGKDEEGKVILSAFQEGDQIVLTIEDDGKGMDADILRESAVIKGMMDEEAASRLTDEECYNLIFAAGFSTKTEISDVSGRGVGMDVVKTRIIGMNGSVHVESELGVGSKVIIKLPLTLAIMSTLMVKLSDQNFALPLSSVVEILSLDLSDTNLVNGQLVVMVRGKAMPLYYLNKWLTPDRQISDEDVEQHVVVVSIGHQHVGFVVDQLMGQEEVVIKPLGALLTQVAGIAGATITGDGSIALIMDIPSMLNHYA